MEKPVVIRPDEAPKFERGNGIETILLASKDSCGAENFTTGMTTFPAGAGVPLHSHNCDEQVTVLEGERAAGRTVMIEFPSEEVLMTWWNSPEYVELAKLRQASVTTHSIIVHAPPER